MTRRSGGVDLDVGLRHVGSATAAHGPMAPDDTRSASGMMRAHTTRLRTATSPGARWPFAHRPLLGLSFIFTCLILLTSCLLNNCSQLHIVVS